MRILKTTLLLAATLTLGVSGAAADENEIAYNLGDPELTYGTTGRNAETYDVALRITDPSLVGVKIKGVRIAFPFTDNLSNAKAWLTKDLPAIKSGKSGEPDITSKSFEISTDKYEVTFDEPYTITGEGVYVGYSFDVAKVETAVEPVQTTGYTTADGFYLHTTKIYRTAWRSMQGQAGDLAIEVILAGENVHKNAASISWLSECNLKTGQPGTINMELVNHGNQGMSSVDYSYVVDGQTYNGHADLAEPVPGYFGRYTELSVDLPALASRGAYKVDVTLTKINGVDNEDASPSAQTLANVYNTLPKHRAVLEEYTGTWCGYCPRGFVGLEEMSRLYPEDFIGMSYHNGDPMEFTEQFPSDVQGFPDAWLDRVYQTDAFCGDSNYGVFGIDKVWLQRCEVFAPAAIEIDTHWQSDNILSATAYVTFPLERDDCPYEVAFALLHDGMTGTSSSWTQSNYYNGDTDWPSSMDQFTQAGSKVSGLVFNDVIVARSGIAGIEGSLSAPIVADVAQEYTYEFDTDQVINTSKENMIQDKSKLRIVAMVIDSRTGEIVNANKVAAGGSTSAVNQLAKTNDDVVDSIEYYDIQGRRVMMPAKGLYVKKETLRGGKTRTAKVIF